MATVWSGDKTSHLQRQKWWKRSANKNETFAIPILVLSFHDSIVHSDHVVN